MLKKLLNALKLLFGGTTPVKNNIESDSVDSGAPVPASTSDPCDEPVRSNGLGRPTCVTANVAAQSGPPYRHVLVQWHQNQKGGTCNGIFVYRNGSGLMLTPLSPTVTEFRDMNAPTGTHQYTVRYSYSGLPGWSEYSEPATVVVP